MPEACRGRKTSPAGLPHDGFSDRAPAVRAVAAMLFAFPAAAMAETTYTVRLETLTDQKAVFATVESPNVVPARARIGGTIASLSVRQGDSVTQGQVIAVVGDDKLLLQINSLDAQIAGLQSQLAQAQTDLTRAETLFASGQRPADHDGAGAHRGGRRHRCPARAHRRARGGAAESAGGPGAGAGRRPRGHGAADQGDGGAERRHDRHDRRTAVHAAPAHTGAARALAQARRSDPRRSGSSSARAK